MIYINMDTKINFESFPTGDLGYVFTYTSSGATWAANAGGSDGCIKYDGEQTLTDAQKMQARKNQGLYYTGEGLVDTLTWDGDTTGKTVVPIITDDISMVKISNDILTASQLTGAMIRIDTYWMKIDDKSIFDENNTVSSLIDYGGPAILIAKVDGAVFTGRGSIEGQTFTFPTAGLYFYYGIDDEPLYINSLKIQSPAFPVVIDHQIDSKYIPNQPYIINIGGDFYDTPTTATQFNEIKNVILANRQILLYADESTWHIYYIVTYAEYDEYGLYLGYKDDSYEYCIIFEAGKNPYEDGCEYLWNPEGGSAGQVLKKTEDGIEWGDAATEIVTPTSGDYYTTSSDVITTAQINSLDYS